MKTSRFAETQILKILKEAEAGVSVSDLCREYGFGCPPSSRIMRALPKMQHRTIRVSPITCWHWLNRKSTNATRTSANVASRQLVFRS